MENKFTVKKVEKAENEGEKKESNEATKSNETVEKNDTVLSGKSTRFTVCTKVWSFTA